MLGVQLILGIVMLLGGGALLALAILGKYRRLPRNYFAGFRTATVMHSDRTWIAAHHAAWIWTSLAGASLGIAGVGVLCSRGQANVFSWATTGGILSVFCIINAAVVAQKAAKREQHKRYDTRPQ